MKNLMIALVAVIALSGCTDAEWANLGAYGDEADVTCYSGGVAVFSDTSTGKVVGTESGVMFRSKTTGRYVKTYADCVVISK
jgi:hypothetical protein